MAVGILESFLKAYDENDIDSAFESVFDLAMEGHTIDPKLRERLPDGCFGVIETNEDGTKKRSYPLRVPGDIDKTRECVSKAIQFFHYCKEPRRAQLAKNIFAVIRKDHLAISINEKSQVLRYINKNSLPKTVTIEPGKQRESRKKGA